MPWCCPGCQPGTAWILLRHAGDKPQILAYVYLGDPLEILLRNRIVRQVVVAVSLAQYRQPCTRNSGKLMKSNFSFWRTTGLRILGHWDPLSDPKKFDLETFFWIASVVSSGCGTCGPAVPAVVLVGEAAVQGGRVSEPAVNHS